MTIPGSSSTALDIIKGSLRNINVLAAGEEPTGAEAQDSLIRLNQMLDAWNADGLMIFTLAITDFPLISNKQTYSLGVGGDFNMQRPAMIEAASIVILSNPAIPVEYPIPIYTTQDWQEEVPIKNVPGSLPLLVYDDGSFPLRNLTFWPVPLAGVNFRIYPWQPLTQFADLKTPQSYPPGYLEALHCNLAIRLAPEFSAQVSPATVELAAESKARIKINNADDTQLRSDLRGGMSSSRMRSELFNIP
jgi:hypothetical protein